MGGERDVFVNCPFDPDFKPFFHAIAFTIVRSGFRVRCALETDDASENRFAKICAIIKNCPFGVHDISRTEVRGNRASLASICRWSLEYSLELSTTAMPNR